ncbi:FixH family protein [Campylobacter armoricus]|uniref:Putative cytochrome c oxidase-associated protein CcoH n=1 Tax=Campylobacter armoricus TaxID=2505970 RepID=A0A7L5HM50_9BACT|nr:FixH family protein [Campylobacter armoricus]QKF79312.1 putative cytochrome c oxidase-associated protein CcoH [Campylobacter armoricus]
MQKQKTFWPYGILISLLLIVLACIITIFVASKAPVYEDNFYFDSYQNVELNYNEIQKNQKTFDENFQLSIKDKESFIHKKNQVYYINEGQNELRISIDNLRNFDLNKLQIQTLLSRPHTNENDEKLQAIIDGSDLVFNFNIKEKGVWQLLVKITQDKNSVGFFKFFLQTK